MPAERWPRVVLLDPNANTPPYDRALAGALIGAGCAVQLATAPFLYEALPPAPGSHQWLAFFRLAHGPLGRRLRLTERPRLRRLLKAVEYPVDWAGFLVAVEHRRPDILHVQWSLNPSFDECCWRWLRRRHIPIVYTAHNLLPHEARAGDERRYRQLYHAADAVVVHTQRTAAALTSDFGVPPSRIAVAPHGPLLEDETELSRAQARCRLGLPTDAPLVLFTGLIERYKGLGDLIAAFARLAARRPDAHLAVAGRPNEPFGPYRQSLASHQLLDRAHLDLRYLSRAELAAYLCAADVVALPYRDTTTSGLLAAARRFGRPVVATAVGDLAEVIVDGEDGLLVPPASPDRLAVALERVLADPGYAAQLGEAGRRRGLSDQSWAEAARRTVALYRDLAPPGRGRRSGPDRR